MNRRDELIRRLRFRDLQMVVSLDRHRSLQRVALEFGVTAPAVTKMLQDAERTLRCSLFRRTTRSVVPTPAGEVVLRHARLLLGQLDLVDRQIEAVERGLAGVRRLGLHPYAHPALLPHLLRRLAERAPQLRVSVFEADTDALIRMLSEGRLDIAVARVSARFSATLLTQNTLYAEPGVVVASPGHPLATQPAVMLEDCLHHPWALPAEGSPNRMAIDAMFAAAGLSGPEPVLEIMSIGSLLSALDGGNLLTVLPSALAQRLAIHRYVDLLPVAARCNLPPVSAYVLKDGFEDPAVRLLGSELQELAGTLGEEGFTAAALRPGSFLLPTGKRSE